MELVVGADGGVRCIDDEILDLRALGNLQITRASHVEPDLDGDWWADMGPVEGRCLGLSGRGGKRWARRGGGYLVRLTTHGSILSPMKDMRSFTVPGSIPCDTISTATEAIFPLMSSAISQARCRTKGKLMPAS